RLTDNLRLMPMRSKQTNTKIDRFSFMFRECCCSDGRNPVGRLLSGHATKYYIGGRAASILTQDTVARASPPVFTVAASDYSPVEHSVRNTGGTLIIRRVEHSVRNTGGTPVPRLNYFWKTRLSTTTVPLTGRHWLQPTVMFTAVSF